MRQESKLQFPQAPQQFYTDNAPLLTVHWWHKSRYAQYLSFELASGNDTAGSTNKLTDSGADFSDIEIGDIVHNTLDDTFAEVTALDSTTVLSLSDDIMDNTEPYKIYKEPSPGYGWVEYRGQTIYDSDSPFNGMSLEDLVGNHYFIRAWEASGQMQDDQFQGHEHRVQGTTSTSGSANITIGAHNLGDYDDTIDIREKSPYGTPRYGDETRPSNIAMVPIVKIKNGVAQVSALSADTLTLGGQTFDGEAAYKYDTGWVANSDWTNAEFTISHSLDAYIPDLIIKFYVSSDGTDANAKEVLNNSYYRDTGTSNINMYGVQAEQGTLNAFKLQTGDKGVNVLDTDGTVLTLDTESWYYRCVVYKPQAVAWHENIRDVAGKFTTGWVLVSSGGWQNVEFPAVHNLNANISDLVVKFYVSSDGTDANAQPIDFSTYYNSATSGTRGIGLFQTSLNEVKVQTSQHGVEIQTEDGTGDRLDVETTWSYKIVIYKPEHISRYEKSQVINEENADTNWHYVGDSGEPAFLNSWTNTGSPWSDLRFRKDAIGFVHIEGSVGGGTSGTSVFTLPVGYRPGFRSGSGQNNYVVYRNSYTDVGAIQPQDDGDVLIYSGSTTRIEIGNVSFYAEN